MENIKRQELIQLLKKEIKEPIVFSEPLDMDLDNVVGYLKEDPKHQMDDYSLELDSSVENLIVKYSYLDCDGDETTSTESIRETLKSLLNEEKGIFIEFFDDESDFFSVLSPIPLKRLNSESLINLISNAINEIKKFIARFEKQVENLKFNNLKDHLSKSLKIDNVVIEEENYIKLNMPIKKLCKTLGTTGFKVYGKLKELGYDTEGRLLVSQADLEDYQKYEIEFKDSNPFEEETEEEKLDRKIYNLISNSGYFDIPFIGQDGKIGLKDSIGNVVVPPFFEEAEGTEYLFEAKCMARVRKDGKLWLSPRDGSGKIIGPGYDKIEPYFSLASVKRYGKTGMVDLTTGIEFIPSQMNWLKKLIGDYVFTQNGKIGYYFYYDELDRYVKPQFDAINLTTHQFLKNGEWGWLLKWGEFTTFCPRYRDQTKEMVWEAEHYIERNPNETERYFTMEEMEEDFKKRMPEMIKERTRTLKSYLTLPQIKFRNGYTPLDKVKKAILDASEKVMNSPDKIIEITFSDKDFDYLGIKVIIKNLEDKAVMEMKMECLKDEDLWDFTSLPYKIQRCFNVILMAPENRPILKVGRCFKKHELSMLSKFITYYFLEHMKLKEEDIAIETHN